MEILVPHTSFHVSYMLSLAQCTCTCICNDLYIYSIVSKGQKGLGTEQEAYMYNHVHVYKLACSSGLL